MADRQLDQRDLTQRSPKNEIRDWAIAQERLRIADLDNPAFFAKSVQHDVTYEAATKWQGELLDSFLAEESANYPAFMRKSLSLITVVPCRNMKWPNSQRASYLQLDFFWLILDMRIMNDESHARRLLHHEVLHCLERIEFGSMGNWDGTEWSGMNPTGFTYRGFDSDIDTFSPLLSEDDILSLGFVSRYAMVSEKEDRAEMWAALMANPERFRECLLLYDRLRRKFEAIVRKVSASYDGQAGIESWHRSMVSLEFRR